MTPKPLEYWRYRIPLAALSLVTPDSEEFPFSGAVIYSGFPPHRCDPNAVALKGVGPIPPGWYDIGAPFDSPATGHYVMRLTPWPGTETFGRSDFEFHGESATHPGYASHGCIVTPAGGLWIRRHVHESSITPLLVEAA